MTNFTCPASTYRVSRLFWKQGAHCPQKAFPFTNTKECVQGCCQIKAFFCSRMRGNCPPHRSIPLVKALTVPGHDERRIQSEATKMAMINAFPRSCLVIIAKKLLQATVPCGAMSRINTRLYVDRFPNLLAGARRAVLRGRTSSTQRTISTDGAQARAQSG